MNPERNPFSPGAGTRPPEIAGRGNVLADAEVALKRVISGKASQSQMFLGLRGTGKTVLLNEVMRYAEDAGFLTSFVETPENRRLAELLYPLIRQTLRRLSNLDAARHLARRGLSVLRGFASAFKIGIGELEIGIEPEVGTADSGDLVADLADLFEAIGKVAQAAGKGWALMIDEVQYLENEELAAIIVAVHRMAQRNLPVVVFAAGLPQIAKLSGDAKSYAERLFVFAEIGPLSIKAAKEAILKPLAMEGVDITSEALDAILQRTSGYPFFLQEWGHHAWNVAHGSPISLPDVQKAEQLARTRLDSGFFRVRFDRLSKAEVEYVNAMAMLGTGPYKVSDIAQQLAKEPNSLGPRRASIIRKGMIYSPSYGEIDFTVPLFDDFLRRTQIR